MLFTNKQLPIDACLDKDKFSSIHVLVLPKRPSTIQWPVLFLSGYYVERVMVGFKFFQGPLGGVGRATMGCKFCQGPKRDVVLYHQRGPE